MLSKMPSCISRQHPKRFENQTNTRPRKWVNSILAIHAALLEAYLADKTRPFRFLILDTPKQDELHTVDLARFLTEFEKMCDENDAQLVFSSTEYDHPTAKQDKRWLPSYQGPEKQMYLGKRTDLLPSGGAEGAIDDGA